MSPLLRSALCAALLFAEASSAESTVTSVAVFQAAALPLDGEGVATERIVKVAHLQIDSDAAQGFTLTVTSGAMENSEGQTPILLQVVTVAEEAPPPGASMFTAAPGEPHVYRSASRGSASRALYVRYLASSLQDPGTYSEVLSVSVADN